MKRYLLAGIVALAIAVTLSGCGTAHVKPEGLSDSQYRLGLRAIETTDKYLNAELSKDLASEQFKNIKKAFEQYTKSRKTAFSRVDSRMEQLVHCLSAKKVSDKSVTKARNRLAEILNQNLL